MADEAFLIARLPDRGREMQRVVARALIIQSRIDLGLNGRGAFPRGGNLFLAARRRIVVIRFEVGQNIRIQGNRAGIGAGIGTTRQRGQDPRRAAERRKR